MCPRDVYSPFYHVVSDEDLPHVRAYPYKSARQFDDDVACASERFGFIEYDELVRSRLAGCRTRPNRFFFTFDDGFAECYHVVRPILREYGAPCGFFITRDFVLDEQTFYEVKAGLCVSAVIRMSNDEISAAIETMGLHERSDFSTAQAQRRLRNRLRRVRLPSDTGPHQAGLCSWIAGLKWNESEVIDRACEVLKVDVEDYRQTRRVFMTPDEIRQLHLDGFTIGAHGVRHHPLGQLKPIELEQEILDSCDFVRQLTGQAGVPFAFPYSGSGIKAQSLVDICRRHDFVELWFDTGGLRQSRPRVVNRFWADFYDDGQTVALDYPLDRYLQRHFSQQTAST